MYACVVNATLAYTEPETGQVIILFINQAIKMKGLDHHLLCLMQYCIDFVMINYVPKFLVHMPNETTHAIKIGKPF